MAVYPIGIYEKALFVKELEEMIDDAARLDFDLFELSIDESMGRLSRLEWDTSKKRKLLLRSKDAGIPIYSMCFSGQRKFPMGSADKETERRSMLMMDQAMNLAEALGIRVIQIAGYDVYYEKHTKDTAKRFDENLKISVEKAADRGIMLSVETVEKYVTNVSKAIEIIERVQSPWLSIYPDIANLFTMGFVPEVELKKGEGRIAALHMREAPDENYIPFGEGALNFHNIFRVLKEINFHGPLIVELWNETNPNYERVLKQAIQFLKNGMEGSDYV